MIAATLLSILLAAFLVAAVSSQGENGAINLSINVRSSTNAPRWAFVHYAGAEGGRDYNAADVQWWTNHTDVMILPGGNFDPYLTTDLQAAKPSMITLYYVDAIRAAPNLNGYHGDGMYFAANAEAESAFLHVNCQISPYTCTSANRDVTGLGSNLALDWMNPGNPTWQGIFANESGSVTKAGIAQYVDYNGLQYRGGPVTGIFADDTKFNPGAIVDMGSPVEYTTDQAWNNALLSFLTPAHNAIKAAGTGKLLIPNIAGEWSVISQALAAGQVDGYFDEFAPSAGNIYQGCGGDNSAGIQLIIQNAKTYPNSLIILYNRSSQCLTDQNRAHILDLSLWYLTEYNRNVVTSFWACGYGTGGPVSSSSCGSQFNKTLDRLDMGRPLSDAASKVGSFGTIWSRPFVDGIAVAKYQRWNGNADSTAETIPLNATYRNVVTGQLQSTVTLRNGEGFIGVSPSYPLSSTQDPANSLAPLYILLVGTMTITLVAILKRRSF